MRCLGFVPVLADVSYFILTWTHVAAQRDSQIDNIFMSKIYIFIDFEIIKGNVTFELKYQQSPNKTDCP